jgi:hypothetical protein
MFKVKSKVGEILLYRRGSGSGKLYKTFFNVEFKILKFYNLDNKQIYIKLLIRYYIYYIIFLISAKTFSKIPRPRPPTIYKHYLFFLLLLL